MVFLGLALSGIIRYDDKSAVLQSGYVLNRLRVEQAMC